MIARHDQRTRYGRMMAVRLAVACAECRLRSITRHVVHTYACGYAARLPLTLADLARYCSVTQRTTRTHIRILSTACGEDSLRFIPEVIDGRRPAAEWVRALELHGGRHCA